MIDKASNYQSSKRLHNPQDDTADERENLTVLNLSVSLTAVKLDRNSFSKQSFQEAAEHQSAYREMSVTERGQSFKYLMQINYGFLGQKWPRMDKQIYSRRSHR
jgi:hypothetical protein